MAGFFLPQPTPVELPITLVPVSLIRLGPMRREKSVDLSHVVHHFINEALTNEYYEGVFENLCDALADAGLSLLRANLSMQILHPLAESVDLIWWRKRGLSVEPRGFTTAPAQAWLQSPFYWMLTNRRRDHRADLKDKRVADKFAIFEELRAAGGTDYLAFSIPFGDPVTAFERRSGICTSWVSDAPRWFQRRAGSGIKGASALCRASSLSD